jgi:hypothetical protein
MAVVLIGPPPPKQQRQQRVISRHEGEGKIFQRNNDIPSLE